jgi:hypothetical protein
MLKQVIGTLIFLMLLVPYAAMSTNVYVAQPAPYLELCNWWCYYGADQAFSNCCDDPQCYLFLRDLDRSACENYDELFSDLGQTPSGLFCWCCCFKIPPLQ